jgi:hypothetical protein
LNLDDAHCWVWDQKLFQLTDSSLFVVVSEANIKVLGNSLSTVGNYTYFTLNSSSLTTSSTVINTICASFTGGGISVAGQITSSSDERIKKDIKKISELDKILLLNPIEYKYIDELNGKKTNYGFIAQDVKKIIPNAVDIKTEIIPNIYLLGKYNNNKITLNSNINFKEKNININNKIKIIDKNCKEYICIINNLISNNIIIISEIIETEEVFVYGTEIDDYNYLNYNNIYTLGISAIQEQHKIIKEHEKRINKLENIIKKLNIDY